MSGLSVPSLTCPSLLIGPVARPTAGNRSGKKDPGSGRVDFRERRGGKEEGTTRRRSTQLVYCHVMICGMASIDADEARPVVVRETEEGRARDP